MLDRTALARDEAIAEALYDAICDSDGAPLGYRALAHHLAKHGLVIVETSKWDSAKTALKVIGSMPPDETAYSPDAVASYAACMAKVAGDAVKKLLEL